MSLEIAKKLYGSMPEKLAKARKKFGRALTLTDGREQVYFCSAACRDSYRARTA